MIYKGRSQSKENKNQTKHNTRIIFPLYLIALWLLIGKPKHVA